MERYPWAQLRSPAAAGDAYRTTIEAILSTTVRGRVFDESGQPVSGAAVTWEGPTHGHETRSTTTDAAGHFVLVDLASTGPAPENDRPGAVSVHAYGFLRTSSPRFELVAGQTIDVGERLEP